VTKNTRLYTTCKTNYTKTLQKTKQKNEALTQLYTTFTTLYNIVESKLFQIMCTKSYISLHKLHKKLYNTLQTLSKLQPDFINYTKLYKLYATIHNYTQLDKTLQTFLQILTHLYITLQHHRQLYKNKNYTILNSILQYFTQLFTILQNYTKLSKTAQNSTTLQKYTKLCQTI
jgi:hypothetical protein